MNFRLRVRLILFSILILASSIGLSLACQVPVFRYALERWVADPYHVYVTPGSGGKFSDEEQAVIDFLKAIQLGSVTNETGVFANLSLTVSENAPENAAGATLAVTYPQRARGYEMKPIWQGALTMENAKGLVESPVRRELVKRLLSGESAVWVLVESGNEETDGAAEKTIEEGIASSIDRLKIPDGVMTLDEAESAGNLVAVNADDILRSKVPLKIDFSVLRISRNDPAEALFLPMLLNIEDDLGEYSNEPMVFPVFGRGRLLEPLIGRGINEVNTLDYAGYISGACSCEVKDQNPGQDLLIAADWDSALEGSEVVIEKVLPPLEGVGILAQANAEAVPAETDQVEADENETYSYSAGGYLPGGKMVPLVALAVLLIIGVGTFLILRKKTVT